MKKKLSEASYLLKKPSSWYLRYRLPNEIQSLSGKTELRLSLHTLSRESARYQVGLVLPDIAQFRRINRLLSMQKLDHIVAQRLLDQLHAEMVQRLRSLQQREMDEGLTFSDNMLDLEHREMDYEIDRHRVALRNNDFSEVSAEAAQTLQKQDVKFNENSPEFRYMCIELLKQKITHCEVIKARCLGDFRREQELLGVQHQSSNGSIVREASSTNPKISEAWNEFFTEKTSGLPNPEWNENTAQGRQAIADELIAILGDIHLSLITRDSVLEYRDKVSRLPKNRKKLYPESSITELLGMDIPPNHLPALLICIQS